MARPTDPSRNPWLRCFHPRPLARARLFCLPHAGGGASAYWSWGPAMPAWLEVCPVQLPGREDRLAEPAHDRLDSLLEELAPALAGWLDRPYALFGHSMGALIAYALAHELGRMAGAGPAHVFVSARAAPHLPPAAPPLHGLPDAEFLAALQSRYGAMSPEVLNNPGLLALLLPLLRKDLALSASYAPAGEPPLACPLTAFGGLADPWVRPEALAEWAVHTRAGFDSECFEGGHLYHLPRPPAALPAAVARRLRACARF